MALLSLLLYNPGAIPVKRLLRGNRAETESVIAFSTSVMINIQFVADHVVEAGVIACAFCLKRMILPGVPGYA